MDKNEVWDFILEYEIATYDELVLVTNINGYRLDVLNDIIYAKTGYRSIDQIKECEPENYD